MQRAIVLLAAAVLLTVSPATATADTPLSHSGNTGTHALVDTFDYTGQICAYNAPDAELQSIRVRWPHVEGYSWTSGSRDRQKVGWKFKILKGTDLNGGGPFTTVFTSTMATAFTYDNQAASWPSRTYAFGGAAPAGYYTVDVLMYWFHPTQTTTITGSARHRVDWSRATFNNTGVNGEFPCPHAL